MDEIITGYKHRYHIEAVVSANPFADTYRAFVRFRAGDTVRRRYYAIMAVPGNADLNLFNLQLRHSARQLPYPVHVEERFEHDGCHYVVVGRGKTNKTRNTLWHRLQNKGLLMLLLAVVILILMIVRFFQGPAVASQPDDRLAHEMQSMESTQ